ncbi:MAG: hypothetical protein IJP03_04505, partial [Christensenellaceae bacterium]|nr:hypothetical protein [Christensenellaceae bacterium]
MKNDKSLNLKPIQEAPEQELVTVTLPKSEYEALFCMQNHPYMGPVAKDVYAMGRAERNVDLYPLPDTYKRRDDVPHGKITGYLMKDSLFYPGVKHKYYTYIPAQYDGSQPADLILFLDAQLYMSPAAGITCPAPGFPKKPGEEKLIGSDIIRALPIGEDITLPADANNVTDLLDNLIADGVIPPTIGVFITPGFPGPGEPVYGASKGIVNRSVEYDTVNDWNARFIAEEFLPLALEGLNVTADPHRQSIVGLSSSGIGAFAVAWYLDDMFSNLILASPSFGNIRNGNIWPSIVRTALEDKDIRTIMCVGRYDADIIFGNWICADVDMASALNYKGYDFRLL